jgi:hypothetical protein
MLVKICKLAFPRKNHKNQKSSLLAIKLKGAPSPKIRTRKNVAGALCMYHRKALPLDLVSTIL